MMHHIPRMDNISKIFHSQSKLIDTVHEVSASNHMNEDSYARQPCILVDSAKFWKLLQQFDICVAYDTS